MQAKTFNPAFVVVFSINSFINTLDPVIFYNYLIIIDKICCVLAKTPIFDYCNQLNINVFFKNDRADDK